MKLKFKKQGWMTTASFTACLFATFASDAFGAECLVGVKAVRGDIQTEDAVVPSLTFSGNTDEDGEHEHAVIGATVQFPPRAVVGVALGNGSAHSHHFSGSTDEGGAHQHTIKGAVTDVEGISLATSNGDNSLACGVGADAAGLQSTALGADSRAQGDNATAVGQDALASKTNSTATGQGARATGDNSTANGQGSVARGANSSAFGQDARATGENSTAIGQSARATGEDSTAIGQDARATGAQSTALGVGSVANASDTTAVGEGARASARDATALGSGARATGIASLAIGEDARASGLRSTAVGEDARATGRDASAFGNGAEVSGGESGVAIGAQSLVHATNGTAIGGESSAGFNGTAVGSGAQANYSGSAAIGRDAQGNSAAATRNNEFVLGTANHSYTAAGITSDASRSFQSGPLEIATTDSNGHLATDGGQVFRTLGEQGAGIAIALALENPDLVGNEKFGLSANLGFFEGNTALGVALMGVLGQNFAGYGERWAVSGGVGVSLNEQEFGNQGTDRTVAGRAGVQVSW